MPAPEKSCKILRKNKHFGAKFSLFLRCNQSTGGGARALPPPLNPPLDTTSLHLRQ